MNRTKTVLMTACLVTGFVVFPVSAEISSGTAAASFIQGASAFRAGEWMSSVFMLRRAVSYEENNTADTWYMLITAEMYAGEYKTAYQDCETYLQNFPESPYVSHVMYHKGRALFCIGEFEKSVLVLSDFCHQYPDHEMYCSALFWVAESFYAAANFDDAKLLYLRIIMEYPDDAKAPAAQFRIETIEQSYREEKLLYLLKETGEEYLAAKEEYERQLRLTDSESARDARKRLVELQKKNSELEKKISELNQKNTDLQLQLDAEIQKNSGERNQQLDMIRELKEKARKTQELLDSQTVSGEEK